MRKRRRTRTRPAYSLAYKLHRAAVRRVERELNKRNITATQSIAVRTCTIQERVKAVTTNGTRYEYTRHIAFWNLRGNNGKQISPTPQVWIFTIKGRRDMWIVPGTEIKNKHAIALLMDRTRKGKSVLDPWLNRWDVFTQEDKP